MAYNPYVCAGKTCREEPAVPASENESDGIHDMECPIDIDVPFIVGKLALNCEKFTFTAGEGLVFKAEKNFVTQQSTMTLGLGLQFQGSKEWGMFSGEASAAASQAFYIVWDKDDNIIDAGLAFQAEGSLKGKVKTDTPFGIGDDYLKKEFKAEGEFGYTLGINSGWTFNYASLNGMVQKIGNLLSK